MQETERHGELVAHLGSHRPRLRKTDVVGMRGCAATEDTGLRGNELQMLGVPKPLGVGERQFRRAGLSWVRFDGWLAHAVEPLAPLLVEPLQHVGVVRAIRGLEIGPGGPEVSDRGSIARPNRL